jgi:hypothetical protein
MTFYEVLEQALALLQRHKRDNHIEGSSIERYSLVRYPFHQLHSPTRRLECHYIVRLTSMVTTM